MSSGPSSRQIKRLPARKKSIPDIKPPIVTFVDSSSEPEVICIDDGSSDIEILGTSAARPSSTSVVTLKPSSSRNATAGPATREIIDISADDVLTSTSLLTILSQRSENDYSSDTDSIPEGFEEWEPTVPLRITRTMPAPKLERVGDNGAELGWHPPKMTWFREDCTGAGSAGAFIEPEVPHHARPIRIDMPEVDLYSERPRRARERSRFGPPRETMLRLESGVLYGDPMVPIPGMNAPRGAVNCIAQSRGYIAVGRTYQEDAAYDGGGLALWSVKTQKAQDIPAHITRPAQSNHRRSQTLPPERIQNSILALAFDPMDNTTLLSAGHENTVQLWSIDEEDDTVELVQTQSIRRPGCMSFCPEGGLVAIGHAAGLQVLNTAESLKQSCHWGYKRGGHETVCAAWGTGRSQHTVVAGTQQEKLVDGRLVWMDINVGKPTSSLDAEACSTLAVDPTGNITAFTGSGRSYKPNRHLLRLYDVQRTGWRILTQLGIPSSKIKTTNGEVIESLWSPDGIHLACARDDNTIDVFDTRWLGQKQCMLVFKHDTEAGLGEGQGSELFGVQGIAWFGSEKLVSGGADCCVRVWDMSRDGECKVLATLGGAVGYLVGSEDPGMFPVIAGDFLGNAYYMPNHQLVPRS